MRKLAKASGKRSPTKPTARAAILTAAIREFAAEGLAGARTDAIARQAGVNKALLYYYFQDKETLYGAALDFVFAGLTDHVTPALNKDLPPREKVRQFVGAHFDYIASNPDYPRMVQLEMTRAGRTGSPHLERIVERYFRPTFHHLRQVFLDGAASGELRAVDPAQAVPSIIAMNIFSFSSLPLQRLLFMGDPLSPERIAARRAAVLDFVSAALFTDCRPTPGSAPKEASR